MNYQKFSLALGFFIFLIFTLIFSFWGHLFFYIENELLISAFFISAIPTIYFLGKWVFNRFKLTKEAQLRSTVLMAVPGMLCDGLCLRYHSIVFPTLTIEQTIVLFSWVIWVYLFILLVGLMGKEESNAIQ
ncbi:MAG: DUF5367 family protein [Aureispira sp.]|nr:DUF5367 family protein [Aureispira sp.]